MQFSGDAFLMWTRIALIACYVVGLTAAVAATGKSQQSTGPEATFGKIWDILHGKRLRLDFTRQSATAQFHFKVVLQKAVAAKNSRALALAACTQIEIVRDRSSIAMLLVLPNGAPFYYLHSGHDNVMATVGHEMPVRVLIAKHVRLDWMGIRTKNSDAKSGIQADSEMTIEIGDAKPQISLRLFNYLRSVIRLNRSFSFMASPVPKIDAWWKRDGGNAETIVYFRMPPGTTYPISRVETITHSGNLTRISRICIGAGLGRSGQWPVVRNAKDFGQRMGLPLANIGRMKMIADFIGSARTALSPPSSACLAVQKRFITWVRNRRAVHRTGGNDK